MADDKPTKVPRYTTDLLKIPGMSFDVTVTDPKERIQAYLDNYRKAGQTRDEVCMDPTAGETAFLPYTLVSSRC